MSSLFTYNPTSFSSQISPQSTPVFYPASSGKEKDAETGYYYFGARYYNSDLSLWLSVDPMSDKYPSLSPYNYCEFNPLKYIDPDGQEKIIRFRTQKPDSYTYQGKSIFKRYSQDLNIYSKNQRLFNQAQKYNDNEGIIHLFAHGSPGSVDMAEHGEKDAQSLYTFLLNNSEVYQKNFEKGETSLLIMHSCKTGKGDNSIAQQLSEIAETDLMVIAPSNNVSLKDGEQVKKNGTWNVFYKGKKIGRYSGQIDFEKQLKNKNPQGIINYWKQRYYEKNISE